MIDQQNSSLGTRIRFAREARRYSLAELGKRVGVAKESVWAWENGKSKPTFGKIQLIADNLGISTDALLRGATDELPSLAEVIADCRLRIANAASLAPCNVEVILHYGGNSRATQHDDVAGS